MDTPTIKNLQAERAFSGRDMIGYGDETPNPLWPNNAKIAISFVVNYEEGGENTISNGDPASEVFLNETPGGTPRKARDPNMETQYEYGSRAGVWRILRMFEEKGMNFTCYAVGKAVELNPEVIQAMVSKGHEIASHSKDLIVYTRIVFMLVFLQDYRWIDYAQLPEEAERNHIQAALSVIKSATGQFPRGWYTGRIGKDSRRLVYEEYQRMRIPLLYDSDAYNDDLPYYLDIGENGHLVIPYTLDQNDMKFCVAPGFTSVDGFFEYLKNCFDVLYKEGEVYGMPKMMSVGLHCRLVGKPGRSVGLQKFLDYVDSFGDNVWVATREEIAIHWRSVHPYIPPDEISTPPKE
ncbi:hypothetical protein HK098_001380 [Nowakowskiella sp. JEL0407]|nr:hypothetical protein HK098_001380 [Nowakowskiella sp. JEL0407]